jgi:hypothetical protein
MSEYRDSLPEEQKPAYDAEILEDLRREQEPAAA